MESMVSYSSGMYDKSTLCKTARVLSLIIIVVVITTHTSAYGENWLWLTEDLTW